LAFLFWAGVVLGVVFPFLVPGAVEILVPSFGTVTTESVRVALFVLVEILLSELAFGLVAGGVFWFGLLEAGLVVWAKAGRLLKAKINAIKLNRILFIVSSFVVHLA